MSKPIVMAKPVRGREMQSTIIPKDVVDTVRAVSTKQIKGESIVENLQKPREGDLEVYHEGYVDGKLYLVPDTNLQAMRDIVNLKMKRRHSSAEKPQTSLDEPTQYTEFRSKLDGLLEKIDQLADSSYDESEVVEGSQKLKRRVKNKKRQDSREKTKKSSLFEEETDETTNESVLTNTNNKTSPKRVMISPMMDENISYIRIRPKDPKKPQSSSKDMYNSGLPNEKDNFDLSEDQNLLRELTEETFKLLISGHLKNGAVPIFINHQNYSGPNILANVTPDFKTHKKEGNIDIFISGKFFTGNILKEESFEAPAVLDVKPHKIVIDKDNDVHRKKFKDIYKVGPLEVALEGEFKKNNKTLKYTPVFSLNIIKNSLQEENLVLKNQSPTPVLYSELKDDGPFKQNQQAPYISGKHVHYASGNKETSPEDVNSIKNKNSKDKGIFGILKNNKIYKRLFSKNEKNDECDKVLELVSSSQQMKARSSRCKREELARLRRSRLRDRKGTKRQNRKLYYNIAEECLNQQVYKSENKTQSLFETSGAVIKGEDAKGEGLNTRKVKKVKKVKKKDKNQAIVENPILAQMQEFFIA